MIQYLSSYHKVLFYLLIFLCLQLARPQFLLNSITISNSTIAAQSTYTLSFSRFTPSAVPLNSNIVLTIDTSYVGLISSHPNCISNDFGTTLLSCSFVGTTLTVASIFSNSSYLSLSAFSISVSNIINPSPATDYVPVTALAIVTLTNLIVDQSSASATVTITPGAATCSINILNPYAFQIGQIAIGYESSLVSGSSYSLSLTMPSSYADDGTDTDISPSISVPVAVSTSPGSYSYTLSLVPSFIITMLMPPSTQPQTNFINIYSFNDAGSFDSCSISISGIKPNIFSNFSISKGTVQTIVPLNFDLTLPTPLQPTDFLKISFDPAFSLNSSASSVSISGYGTFPLTKLSSILQLSGISQQSVLSARLIFSIAGVGMPFTSSPAVLNVSLVTFDNYNRIFQSYSYSAALGTITGSLSCLSYQIGSINTNCIISIKTSSYINSNGLINIVLPNAFTVPTGSQQCGVSGLGLNSLTTCLYFAINNTIQAPNLSSSASNIPPLNLSLNVTLNMSNYVGSYSISLSTQTQGSNVDSGLAPLSTVSRQLKQSEFSVSSSSLTTYSPTVYYCLFSLPFSLGVGYSVVLSMPFDVQSSLSPSLSPGMITSYSYPLLNFTDQLSSNQTISVSNLMTYASLQPSIISANIYFNGVLYFYGSSTITLTTLKQFNFSKLQQSNQVVYASAIATISLSGLLVGDKIALQPSYSYFYQSQQPNCSIAVVQCGFSNILTTITVNSTGVTTFSINMQNLGYIGNSIINVTAYDSQQVYSKQSSLVNLITSIPNLISVATILSNPYLNEKSTYTFTLVLTTPNASNLLFNVPAGIVVSSVTCVLNCGQPTTLSIGYLFSVASTNLIISIALTNPMIFSNTTPFVFKTSNLLGDMDFGQFFPQMVCNLPCRSCSSINQSLCLSCYSWQSQFLLLVDSCVSSCPSGYFQSITASSAACLICDQRCTNCFGTSSNCSSCSNGSYFYSNGCYKTCPTATFSIGFICVDCSSNCSACSNSSDCLSCSQGLLFNRSCVSACPSNFYESGASCITCNSSCLSCSQTNGSCFSCTTGYLLYQHSCLSSCPNGSFISAIQSACQTCQPPCLSCSIYSTNCTSCLKSYNSTSYFYLLNQCFLGCPPGYYTSIGSNTCINCPAVCLTCSDNACLSCNSSLLLFQGSCISACPAPTYSNGSACLLCSLICSSCVASMTCTSCISGYFLYNSSCQLNCPDYYYANSTNKVCLQCNSPCALCDSLGCLSCVSGDYLQQRACVNFCSGLYHPNNSTMSCQICQNPCGSCTWSNVCSSCISGYSLWNQSCLVNCPSTFYSNSNICYSCPSDCQDCVFEMAQPICTSCPHSNYIYQTSCVSPCPNTTQISGIYCASSDCASLAHCLSCSGTRCIQCTALYTMDSSQSCSVLISSSGVLAAMSQIPVPFPFLIAIIMVIIISFLLKHNFQKMFSPLFIYSFGGIFQFLCLSLWTVLSVLWNLSLDNSQMPIISVVNAPIVIIGVYMLFNIVEFILWKVRISADKKYRLWEKQDNRCSSVIIAIIALFLSFRFDTLKYSKVGHKYQLSARLTTPEAFTHYSALAVLAIFLISLSSLVVSIYISSLQTSLNYLFFTGLEVTIIAVIMLVMSIAMLCVPKKQLLEDRQEYQSGFGQDELEGKSNEALVDALGVVEEHHQNNEFESQSANAVLMEDGESISLDKPDDGFKLEVDSGDQQMHQIHSSSKDSQLSDIFIGSEAESSSHILVDEIELQRKEVIQLSKQFKTEEKRAEVAYPGVGKIVKQRLSELQSESEEIQSMQSFEQFTLDCRKKEWHKMGKDILLQNEPVQQGTYVESLKEREKPDSKLQRPQFSKKKEQSKANLLEQEKMLVLVYQQKRENERLKRVDEQRFREQKEKLLQKELADLEAKQKELKDKLDQQIKVERIRVEEWQRLRREQDQMKAESQRKQKQQANKQELQLLNSLSTKLAHLHEISQALNSKEQLLGLQQFELQQIEGEKERQDNERVLMAVEDRLSRMAVVFEQMWSSSAMKNQQRSLTSRRNALRQQQQQFLPCDQQIKYHNEEGQNLVLEASPRKVKVNPQPLPKQYRRQHLFVDEGTEILSDQPDEQLDNEEINIIFDSQQQPHDPKSLRQHSASPNQTHPLNISKRMEPSRSPLVYQHFPHEELKLDGDEQELSLKRESRSRAKNRMRESNSIHENDEIREQSPSTSVQHTEKHNQLEVLHSDHSVHSHSQDTHWPIQPEMQQWIEQVEKRADSYIVQPRIRQLQRDQRQPQTNEAERHFEQIVFEQSEQILSEESEITQKRYPKGRVNRRVIDLSPDE